MLSAAELILLRHSREKIEAEIEARTKSLVDEARTGSSTVAASAGYITGLRDALNVMEDIGQKAIGLDRPSATSNGE